MSQRWPACLAALSVLVVLASTGLCKPPDLPRYQNIVVLPHTPESGDPAVLTAFGVMSNYPIQLLDLTDKIPFDDDGPCGEEISEDFGIEVGSSIRRVSSGEPTQGQCPWTAPPVNQVKKPVPATRSVLDNLDLLIQANESVEKAEQLANEGKLNEAIECLKKACESVAGSPCEARIKDSIHKINKQRHVQKIHQLLKKQGELRKIEEEMKNRWETIDSQREQEQQSKSECGYPGCCPEVHQVGMCWMSQVVEWMKKSGVDVEIQVKVKASKKKSKKVKKSLPEACNPPKVNKTEVSAPAMCCPQAHVLAPCSDVLAKPLAARFEQVPLITVLDHLRGVTGCQVVIDYEGLQKAGVSPIHPVSLQVEGMPLYSVLDLLLRSHGLHAAVCGNTIRVTCAARAMADYMKSEASDPCACEDACPKCKELHDRVGKKLMFNGLMKACRLAIADGRFTKAADLARQAHTLDPNAVENDPMIIKMDLLNQYKPCKAIRHGAAPGMPISAAAGSTEESEAGVDGTIKLVPQVPGLIDPQVLEALDRVLRSNEMPRK